MGILGVCLGECLLVTIDGDITSILCRFWCGMLHRLLADSPSEFFLVSLVVGAVLCWLKRSLC